MSDPAGFRVDLTNCEREPIHVLGNIQPFGFLVAIAGDGIITRASANVQAFTGKTPQEMLGQPVAAIFAEDAVHAIRNRVTLLRGPDAVERLFDVALLPGKPLFDVAVHFSGDAIVMEAEPARPEEMEASALVRSMITRQGQSENVAAFLREGARQVRALTGFDRVMVYRFDDQGSGEVAAESLQPGIDSFLGLHYPASDIPAQARKLYLRNIFRVIADVEDIPVPLVAAHADGEALDQSLSVLRAVSPIHIEYLKNMGVRASLSISIIVDGKLWGLFACHHYAPRLPSFAYRTAAELFGQLFSLMLESRLRRESAAYETRAREVTDRLMAAMAQDSSLLHNAVWIGDMVLDTIPADGVGVFLEGSVSLTGLTPDREQFAALIRYLTQQAGAQLLSSDCLGRLLPEAAAYADRAAGMLAIPLSRKPGDYVVLFRSEQLRAVRWAGNPEKPVELGPHGARLTPRKSFEAWSELVKGQALPFSEAERRIAEALRSGMLEVLMRLSDSAGEERARAHERQELLIAELNHRVRNILALIRGLISQSRAGGETVEGFIATLDARIRALARAHDQITADRWGPARLAELIETESGAFLGEKRNRVKLDGPPLLIQPAAFTSLALVFHELVTNAAKYGALSDNGSVTVRWWQDSNGDLVVNWNEEGGPAVTAPTRRGFGSTIIEQSIPYDLGGEAEVHFRVGGLSAQFRIPARHIAGLARPGRAEAAQGRMTGAGERPLDGKKVLIVEDSMIIALDAEDAVESLGAQSVSTAANVAQALQILEQEDFAFALLDVNLGPENSFAVADILVARGLPFLFATGYGESIAFPERLAGAPVINKPYGAQQLREALASLRLG